MKNKTRWQIGELARKTGLSVRTLHYYDQLGLLVPSGRSEAGYRLYTGADLLRLRQILSLRQLGFSLAEIGDCLRNRRFRPGEILDMHIDRLRKEIELREETCRRLQALARHLETQEQVSGEEFMQIIGVIKMFEKYYSAEQLEYLVKRRQTLGEEVIQQVEKEWPELIAQVRAEMEKGTAPTEDKVRALAQHWDELVQMFTGGDEGISRSLGTMYRENPGVAAGYGMDKQLLTYVSAARQAR
ncbi:MAG TPA: MerR family transcriptional regulator [Spirochaetia bacterium]|nr:MerR family transcriptional regulator [Spirochaetia bacterium]